MSHGPKDDLGARLYNSDGSRNVKGEKDRLEAKANISNPHSVQDFMNKFKSARRK